MIKVGQYPVVVPDIYIDKIYADPRTDPSGDRNELRHSVFINNNTIVNLPWDPTAPEWVEIYHEGVRIINSRVHTADGRTYSQMAGTIYEDFNITGNVIEFSDRITGNLEIVCDTQAAHWWGSAIINCENVQRKANATFLANINLPVEDWPIISGAQRGFDVTIKYKPGPIFNLDEQKPEIQATIPISFNAIIDADQRSSTNTELVYSTSIQDDYVADGINGIFQLTRYPSSNNLIVYVGGVFVDQTEYTVANANVLIANTYVDVTEVTFANIPTANANVQINYVPSGASYQFEVMREPGTINGIATDFLSMRIESALYAEPIVISEPVHGYARLTTDRRKIAYVPNAGFEGIDYFKWSMVTQHGQVGDPICIEVVVQTQL